MWNKFLRNHFILSKIMSWENCFGNLGGGTAVCKKICWQTSCFAYRKQCEELYKYAGLSEWKINKRSPSISHLYRFDTCRIIGHYGGAWMDATILLTDEIPQEILNSDFFVFHNSLGEIDNPVLYPVWFSSTPSNIIERFVRFVMFCLTTENEIIMYRNVC